MTASKPTRGLALGLFPDRAEPLLYDRVIETFRVLHYSRRTQASYVHWIGRFIRFSGGRHPRELSEVDVGRFLSHLAVDLNVAAATQNQALSALLFLYKHVVERPLAPIQGIVRANKPRRLPVVLTETEVDIVLGLLEDVPKVVCMILYGSGLRLTEALELRVKDLDFGRGEIVVRGGKGDRDRVTMMPTMLHEPLTEHLRAVQRQHAADLAAGLGRVPLPGGLARKYPNADREWCWQRVFPASSHYTDRRTGVRHRHHLHESVVQKAVRTAALRSGIPKRITPHTFRHSFRHASPRERLRHPDGPGTPRPSGRQDDDDLHPCAEQRGPRREKPTRSSGHLGPRDVLCRPRRLHIKQEEHR